MHRGSFGRVARRLALISVAVVGFAVPAQAATPWHRVLLGRSAEELAQDGWRLLVEPSDLEEVLATAQSIKHELRIPADDR